MAPQILLKSEVDMSTRPGTQIAVWAVEHPRAEKLVTNLSYNLWQTPEEAMERYSKLTGKTWTELVNEGARVVQRSVIVDKVPDRSTPH